MNICLMCDLHLPTNEEALQYSVLEWAIADIIKKQPQLIVFCGDATCDGNEAVYDSFLDAIKGAGIPFLYIPGNSDLRCEGSKERIHKKASPIKTVCEGISVYAVNDSDGTVSDGQLEALAGADGESIVFMHHPPSEHDAKGAQGLALWLETHRQTRVFYGHLHRALEEGNQIGLLPMDPDKSVGESPCITYYDTDTGKIRRAHYFAPVPTDLYAYFGISCFRATEQIAFAVQRGLKHLELRPSAAAEEREQLRLEIERWRRAGGEQLSVHLPDMGYRGGEVFFEDGYDDLLSLVDDLGADRVTQHVPKVAVGEVEKDPTILDKICDAVARRLNAFSRKITVGVENMHMTKGERADEKRRFGYTPQECLCFMEKLAEKCKHRVGINFDIGHARNNAPYSQSYQISSWFAALGKHIVAYHLHQVRYEGGTFENHMPIDEIYGHLISFASFFKCWATNRISKAPVIFEMRPENAYEITLDTFDVYKKKTVFDLHSHSFFSRCGRDPIEAVIQTAVENGLSVFAITDHNYGIGERKAEYVALMRAYAEQYRDKLRLLCGIEIATVPEHYDIKAKDEIEAYDYCLIEHITYENSIVKDKLFEFCDGLGIICGIAHTDLFAYCDMYGFAYDEFFRRMAEHNIFWEMNVSFDSIHHYKEHSYVADFMTDPEKQRIVRDAGVFVSVGFDSHRCEDYDGFRVHRMYDFLKEKNIKTADALFPLRTQE